MSEHIHLMKCLCALREERLDSLLELPDFSIKQGTVIRNDTAFFPYRRVYMVSEESGDYTEVGWVLNSSMQHCMICMTDFSFWNRRHHCRACGNLICGTCSPFAARIESLDLPGKHRVCKECVMQHCRDSDINFKVSPLYVQMHYIYTIYTCTYVDTHTHTHTHTNTLRINVSMMNCTPTSHHIVIRASNLTKVTRNRTLKLQ